MKNQKSVLRQLCSLNVQVQEKNLLGKKWLIIENEHRNFENQYCSENEYMCYQSSIVHHFFIKFLQLKFA